MPDGRRLDRRDGAGGGGATEDERERERMLSLHENPPDLDSGAGFPEPADGSTLRPAGRRALVAGAWIGQRSVKNPQRSLAVSSPSGKDGRRSRRGGTDMKVLLVEDEAIIAAPLVEGLEHEGFEVVHASTGADALAAGDVDLVLLDLRLPDVDGYELCRTIRRDSDVPIIMITSRGEEVDRVIGLELGADDYVVKPFGFRELMARIRAVLRRTQPRAEAAEPVVVVGPLELDQRARRVTVGGREVSLTCKEFDLLTLLANEAGAVVTRRRVLEEVWDTQWGGGARAIDVHLAALRRKLGDRRWIETVRGVGFRLQAPA
ncbi:MAG: response regulator transcription factor [Thermoleophilia bacterium]